MFALCFFLQTLFCGNVLHDQLVQITGKAVKLVNAAKQEVATWRPPQASTIIAASANSSQAVIATSEGKLIYLQIGAASLSEVSQATTDGEVSCLDITPIGEDSVRGDLVVVGTWSMKLLLYTVDGLRLIATYEIGGEIMPRR